MPFELSAEDLSIAAPTDAHRAMRKSQRVLLGAEPCQKQVNFFGRHHHFSNSAKR